MFDCGMHMGYNDERRFPDFNYIIGDQVLGDFIKCFHSECYGSHRSNVNEH